MGVQLQPKLKTMEKNEYGRGTQSCLIDKAGEAEYLHSLQGQIEKANVNAFSYLTRQMFIELIWTDVYRIEKKANQLGSQ